MAHKNLIETKELRTSAAQPWLLLDNWKTLFRATFPEPILQFQKICNYKTDSDLSAPDPAFMHVCLTTASERVRHALHFEGRFEEEDPAEYLRLVSTILNFTPPPGAAQALTELVEIERNGLCKFLDVSTELRRFRQLGFKIALVSNVWPFPMPQIFNQEEGGLAQSAFDRLILSYEVGQAKPSRQFYLETLRRCGAAPSDCMMVGDNPELDIRPALACGISATMIDRYGESQSQNLVTGVPVIKKLRQLFE